ncbi:MAG: hypothetical protein KF819_32770 [Labilithrix sp.]|nr:hypothetical protein [Labilithrix sp.]
MGACSTVWGFDDLTSGDAGADSASADATDTDAVTEVSQLYYTSCYTKVAPGRVDRALRFYTETTFRAGPGGDTGSLSLRMTPLKLDAEFKPPPTVSKSEIVGATIIVNEASTNARGVYAAPVGYLTIDRAANPLNPSEELFFEDVAIPGRFTEGRFCSQWMSRSIVRGGTPTPPPMEGPENTCIYVPVNEGDPTPTLGFADYPLPCLLE